MPKAFPKEFRDDVVRVARKRDAPISQIAKDFGVSEACIHRWLKIADVEDGVKPGVTKAESDELRDLKKRNRLQLRDGDTLVVWKLDRLGRSTLHCIEIANELRVRGIDLASITDGIDTSTTNGRLYFAILAALGEAERERIQERTLAGLEAARRQGRVGGRPSVMTKKKFAVAQQRLDAGETGKEVAESIGVGPVLGNVPPTAN